MIKINELKIFNQDVIPVYTTDTGEKVIIGRELHEKLGIKANYREWFPRMSEYGFEENVDYSSYVEKSTKPQNGGRPSKNHILSLDMAKHIAMIQRSKIGMKIRQKLIDLYSKNNVMICCLISCAAFFLLYNRISINPFLLTNHVGIFFSFRYLTRLYSDTLLITGFIR